MRDFLGIGQSIRRMRTAHVCLKKQETKVRNRKERKVSKDRLQKRIDAVKERTLKKKAAEQRGVLRREFLSLGLKGLGALTVASPGIVAAIRWACSFSSESQIPPSDPRSETIRRILFGPEEIDSTSLNLHQFRSLVEATFEREVRALINDNEKITMNIFGERILVSEPFAIERANQALRRIGSNKRIWIGVIFTNEYLLKTVVFGQISREERLDNCDTYLIVFPCEGLIINSPSLPLAASDGLGVTALFESSLWDSIQYYFRNRQNGIERIQLFANELFRSYGITSLQQLQDHRDELLQDFAEFVMAHECGHYETVSRIGGFHKGFKSALPPPGIIATNRPISYNLVIDEFIADLAGLQHITSLAQNDTIRGRRLILLYLMLSVTEFEQPSDENLEHAIYRSMGFAIVQSALSRNDEGIFEIDFNQLARSVSLARQLTEAHLRRTTQDFRNQLLLRGYGNKMREIERQVISEFSQFGLSQKQLEEIISQSLFISLFEDRQFLLFNSVWQNDTLVQFEKAFMQNRELVGSIAGRYEYPLELSNAPVDEWLR